MSQTFVKAAMNAIFFQESGIAGGPVVPTQRPGEVSQTDAMGLKPERHVGYPNP
jgi:hypothetical protein